MKIIFGSTNITNVSNMIRFVNAGQLLLKLSDSINGENKNKV